VENSELEALVAAILTGRALTAPTTPQAIVTHYRRTLYHVRQDGGVLQDKEPASRAPKDFADRG